MHDMLPIWTTILSLALMFVGGLMLWAYGGSRSSAGKFAETGMEAEAARMFHRRLARWFFIYGSLIVTVGLLLLLWSASNFLGNPA